MIIGIYGKAGAGKTTLANELVDLYSGVAYIVPFASPLKDFARRLGWDGEKDEKGRKLLQLLGTDCGRECIHPDIWVDHWEHAALPLIHIQGSLVIADDVRFDNEADKIVELGGTLIEVVGRGYDLGAQGSHASESGISPRSNHLFSNSGTIGDIRTWVQGFLNVTMVD